MYIWAPWGILVKAKISLLSVFSSWFCDLFTSCVAVGLRAQGTHEGNKSHDPSLQVYNSHLFHCQCCNFASVFFPMQDKYGFEVSIVVHGVKIVYVPLLPGHSKRLDQK